MTTLRTKRLVTTTAARHAKNLGRLAMEGWLLASLTGCEKAALDRQVMELCAKDGGVTVYETVPLTPELLDWAGRIHVPAKDKAGAEDPYYYERIKTYLVTGNPSLWRSQRRIYRVPQGRKGPVSLLLQPVQFAEIESQQAGQECLRRSVSLKFLGSRQPGQSLARSLKSSGGHPERCRRFLMPEK